MLGFVVGARVSGFARSKASASPPWALNSPLRRCGRNSAYVPLACLARQSAQTAPLASAGGVFLYGGED